MAETTSRKRPSTQTVLVVCTIVVVTLVGLCTESSFADGNIRVSSTNNNSRTRTRQRSSKQPKATTAAAPPSTKKPSDRVYLQTWLSIFLLYSNPPQPNQICDSTSFSKQQRKVCKQNKEFAIAYIHAARSAIQQCQIQFRYHRWNCSVVDPHTVFGNLLRHGTRETAFVYAIASASLTTIITKACSSGDMKTCYCDRNPKAPVSNSQSLYEEKGCSDNVHYGMALSRSFVDSREKGRVTLEYPARTLMNLHNNEAGRLIVESSLRSQCKCVGISGSCTSKTCAKVLPKFEEIAPLVKAKYDLAVKVLERRTLGGKRQLVAHDGRSQLTPQQLVHLQESYDFCDSNPKMGSLGTRGRLCNSTSQGEDSCSNMCCTRDYHIINYRKTIDCNCVFKFCCKIECQKCEAQITENRCK